MEKDYLNHKKRLRERYLKDGLDGFQEYELLELILSYSLIRKDTKPLAKKLISHFGSLIRVLNAPVDQLIQFDGLSTHTAVLIKLFRDAHPYILKAQVFDKNLSFCSSDDVYHYFKAYFKGKENEEMHIIHLNSQNLVLEIEKHAEGTVSKSAVFPRTLIQSVIRTGASGVILVHNHPGGSLIASPEDHSFTKSIKELLPKIDARLLDHLIIGDNDYCSLMET